MAFYFNNSTSDGITIADHANLSMLVSTGWTHSIWVKSDDRTGTANRRIMAWHDGGASNNYFILSVGDASAASFADDIRIEVSDDDGTSMGPATTSNPFASNTSWTHVVVQLSGTTVSIYINGSSVLYQSNAAFDDINRTSSWKFGNNQYDNTNWKGAMAEWAKWDRALSDAEILALSKGFSPDHYKRSLVGYMPMIRDYKEVIANMSVTNNGTTVVAHPRITYPSYTIIGKSSAATQTLSLPVISSTLQLLNPALVPGAVNIGMPAISSGTTLYAPTLIPQAQNLTLPIISSAFQAFNPSFVVGSVNLGVPLIDSTLQMYAPEILNATQQNHDLPFISSTTTLYNPSFVVGSVALSVPVLENPTQLFTPTLTPGSVTLGMPFINSTATFFNPSISTTYNLSMPLIPANTVLFDPSMVPGQLTLPMPFIPATTQLFAPGFVFAQSLAMPVISGNTILYAPTIRFSFTKVEPNTGSFVRVN